MRKNDGYLNLGRDHWFYSKEHKTKWVCGSNLFGSWRWETEEDWERNWEFLKEFVDIAPIKLPEDFE